MFYKYIEKFLNFAFNRIFNLNVKRYFKRSFKGYVFPYKYVNDKMIWIFFDKNNEIYFAKFTLETLPCTINEEIVLVDGKEILVEFEYIEDVRHVGVRDVDVKTFTFYDPHLEDILRQGQEV